MFSSVFRALLICGAVADQNLLDLVKGRDELSTFTSVLSEQLQETLASSGTYTVFAPSNDAFAELTESALSTLQEQANTERVIEILKFHIGQGLLTSKGFNPYQPWVPQEAYSVNGVRLQLVKAKPTFDIVWSYTTEGRAHVVTEDLLASNGAVHIIDKVYLRNPVAPIAV